MKAATSLKGLVFAALLFAPFNNAFAKTPNEHPLVLSEANDGDCSNNIKGATLTFSGNSYAISAAQKVQLDNLAQQMLYYPDCKVVVLGNGGGSKIEQQMSWSRVDAIIGYLSDTKNIDRRHFIFMFGQAGDASTVDFRGALNGEDGPSSVSPPFPGLIK